MAEANTKIQYNKEFLLSLKHLKYSPPASVVIFNELYVYAPKPPVHRPVVESRKRSEFATSKPYVTLKERNDLQRKRKDLSRKKEHERESPSKKKESPSKQNESNKSDEQIETRKSTLPASEKEKEEPTTDTLKNLLEDAQEQITSLTTKEDADVIAAANKPEIRSLLRTKRPPALESDERRIAQRQKQIQYGYVTEGYKNYINLCPKDTRKKGDPQTPNIFQKCSKRSWDGQIRIWRRCLHQYDTAEAGLAGAPLSSHVTTEEREILAAVRRQAKEKHLKKAAIDLDPVVLTPQNVSADPSKYSFEASVFASAAMKVLVQKFMS